MFKIGDYIKIKDCYKDRGWYTDETYQITKDESDIVVLDRIIFKTSEP